MTGDRVRSWLGWIGVAAGCRATVQMELPPSPAVALSEDTVAVVASDRACQPAADALARHLGRSSYLRVDPRSPLRVELFACGDDQSVTVEQEQGPDGTVRERTRVEARAYAVVEVSQRAHGARGEPPGSRLLASLIATGREDGANAASVSLPRLTRQARHRVHDRLAQDVVRQLNPLPTLVERRVYPNAPEGTARELTTLAVLAEQEGDLRTAIRLAEEAWRQDPNRKTAAYLEELKNRVP